MDGTHCYRMIFAPKGRIKAGRLHFEPIAQRIGFGFGSSDDEEEVSNDDDDEFEVEDFYKHTLEVDDPGDIDKYSLHQFLIPKGAKFFLHYDYGDDWFVAVRVKKVFVDDKLDSVNLPRVLKGEGYGIVEDAGGVWGLEELFEVSENGERSERYLEWFQYDGPEISDFDLDDMNAKLHYS
jgi:hypothetical protein